MSVVQVSDALQSVSELIDRVLRQADSSPWLDSPPESQSLESGIFRVNVCWWWTSLTCPVPQAPNATTGKPLPLRNTSKYSPFKTVTFDIRVQHNKSGAFSYYSLAVEPEKVWIHRCNRFSSLSISDMSKFTKFSGSGLMGEASSLNSSMFDVSDVARGGLKPFLSESNKYIGVGGEFVDSTAVRPVDVYRPFVSLVVPKPVGNGYYSFISEDALSPTVSSSHALAARFLFEAVSSLMSLYTKKV